MDDPREPEQDEPSPPGDGPYRTPPERTVARPRRWLPLAIGGLLSTLAVLIGIFGSDDERRARPALSSIPTHLFGNVNTWPAPEAELPPSTPLAPLLAADQPQALAVMSPGEGASRLRRGQSITVRFNRPMVDGVQVGRTPAESPLVFSPHLEGEATWINRAQVSFVPAPRSWTAGVRETRLSFAPGLASLGGEVLDDDLERVVVLDGAPRIDPYRSSGRVNAGAPLPLFFDARVSPASLAREILAYEVGGGQRSVPISLAPAREQPERGFRLDARLRRTLEPGVRIALALAPRYQAWGGSNPAVLTYELAPRPHIEGVGCNEGAAYAGQCTFHGSPGHVIDIGPALRVLSSARLSSATASNLRIRPALRGLTVRLAPHGPPQGRLVEIRGEWEPDQVYEVRLHGLRTEDGEIVRALAPLAIRSGGSSPQIRVAAGRLAFEREAVAQIPFAVIHAEPSDVLYRAVAEGEELRALVSPGPFARQGGVSEHIAPLAPDARPNRWGAGHYVWRDGDQRSSSIAVVQFRPNPGERPNAASTAFVQATDLGVTVRANREGMLIWVTRLSSAEPVEGAEVTVADAQADVLAQVLTDPDGIARIPLGADPLVVSHAILVNAGSDRAALLLDPRRALGPSSMGLTPGADPQATATIFADRGAYRPGEGVHAKLVLRRVEGDHVSPVRTGTFLVQVFAPGSPEPFRELPVTPSRFGTAAVDFDLPISASVGAWRLAVRPEDRTEVQGSTTIDVAHFRQPTFRVDVSRIAGPVHAGDHIGAEASATYLFGAPVTTGRVRWSLSRVGAASYPERWRRFAFTPAGAGAGRGTVASGDDALGSTGALHVDAQVQLAASVRTRLSLEAEVTDRAGHTHSSRRSFTAYPAEVEVGLERGDDWVELGAALDLGAIAIDHAGDPVEDQAIAASFIREGWHSWWEWSEASRRRTGAYQLRRDQRRQVVHHCALRSTGAPVHCAFTPPRSGTYRLEVTTRDGAGRESTASRRVYVAGPDEHPDRDPPGAPIEVTPTRRDWNVGETAELAFESPWERAEALITVEREGVMRVERRSVGPGGQIIHLPVTAEMVPNAYVGVTLVRPRGGPPTEGADLDAPDLRFGIVELRVTPARRDLQVTIEVEGAARPGTDVPVNVQVRDAEGQPMRAEVALWAVDEGTLRLTDYQVPDPMRGLFRRRPAHFAWEDLRRELVSRIEPPPTPEASGDGREGEQARSQVDDRERFDPTPLWAPRLVTGEDGRASATITLPARPTEYRVMAVAVDARARAGRASASLVAEQPIVVRPAFPGFITAGDTFEAVAFVHNATEEELTTRVWATVSGERREAREVSIPAGGEVRVSERVNVPEEGTEGPLALRFDATSGDERAAVQDEIGVAPRARFVRSQVFGATAAEREIAIGLPENTPSTGGRVMVTIAAHPFVGFEGALEALEASTWAGADALAATIIGLTAHADLGVADPSHGVTQASLEARGRRATRRLLALQNVDGAFGRWSSGGGGTPRTTALAVHALTRAQAHGWLEDEAAYRRAVASLIPIVNGTGFTDRFGETGLDQTAYGLRVLNEAGSPQSARASALHQQRDRLSPYGLAQLAMALGEEDSRADTLVLEASRTVLATRNDEARDPTRFRWFERSARIFGAVLEASSRFEVGHARVGNLAGELLAIRGGRIGYPWGTSLDTARGLMALAAYARLWDWAEGERPTVTLDGSALPVMTHDRAGAFYRIPVERLRGNHTLGIVGADDGPVFFSIDGRWGVPLGEPDAIPRGRRTAVHRVYETADGRPLQDGAEIRIGELVRVRLFVYTESMAPEVVTLSDPLPAGFDAIDRGHDPTPRASLSALFGTSADDGAMDARAHHAMRSLSSVGFRELTSARMSYYFDQLPTGLQEYTYAIRATTVGEFTVPPAQIEALHDPEFVARSSVGTLRVRER